MTPIPGQARNRAESQTFALCVTESMLAGSETWWEPPSGGELSGRVTRHDANACSASETLSCSSDVTPDPPSPGTTAHVARGRRGYQHAGRAGRAARGIVPGAAAAGDQDRVRPYCTRHSPRPHGVDGEDGAVPALWPPRDVLGWRLYRAHWRPDGAQRHAAAADARADSGQRAHLHRAGIQGPRRRRHCRSLELGVALQARLR
jgi:hypothetical protein